MFTVLVSSLVSSLVSPLVSLCLIAPVSGPIVEPFVAPACPYCAGNRAIEFATTVDEVVRAPIGGIVHFAGTVAGRRYLTVRTDVDLVTVGGIGAFEPGVARGRQVRQGQVVAIALGPDGPVSLSRRPLADPSVHLDPAPSLGRLVTPGPRARLVPRDGTVRRPAPRAVCRPDG